MKTTAACLAFGIFNLSGAKTIVVDLSGQKDATPMVLEAMHGAKEEGVAAIVFKKGEYHFYPDKAFEKFCFVSNHDDGLRRTAFPILDWNGLSIDGGGSTFIFHGVMIPFLIEGSSNIEVKNVSIDWEVPFHSEGVIAARDVEGKTFDLRIAPNYPYEIRNGQLIFIKESYEHTLGEAILYDPVRNSIALNTEAYTPLTGFRESEVALRGSPVQFMYPQDPRTPQLHKQGHENALTCEEVEPGLVRIHGHQKQMPPVGMILAAKGEHSENRVAPAFRIADSNGIKVADVNVFHAGGMGLIAEGSGDIRLRRFNVAPSRGRMVSTTADATHFVGCRGTVELIDCSFSNQLDDGSNVHGAYQRIDDILGPKKIGVTTGHFQQLGYVLGKAGDEIGLVRIDESFLPYHSLRASSVELVNGRYTIVTFEEELPAGLRTGDLIENLSAYPEFSAKGCSISGSRARGLLLSTPKKTLVENCYFSVMMSALLLPVENGYWFESGSASNVRIANNDFGDCAFGGDRHGVIRFVVDGDSANPAFSNIEIVGNRFRTFDNLILEIGNVDGLKFSDNDIEQTDTLTQIHPDAAVVEVAKSRSVQISGNRYAGSAKTRLTIDDRSRAASPKLGAEAAFWD